MTRSTKAPGKKGADRMAVFIAAGFAPGPVIANPLVLVSGMPSDGRVARKIAARKTNASWEALSSNLPFGRCLATRSLNTIEGNRF
jgi:hypothetical protein